MWQGIISFITNPQSLISAVGALGVIAIIFLETGAFFGFFLPGDSLLFTAGYLASAGHLSIAVLLIGCFVAAVLGDSTGYAFGKKIGPAIFTKENSIFFNRKNIEKAKEFYDKHGRKTILLARFIPIIRTFAPIVAGVGGMEYKKFLFWNVLGGLIWTVGLLLFGYIFGSVMPDPDKYIIAVVLGIIVVSAAPAFLEILKKFR